MIALILLKFSQLLSVLKFQSSKVGKKLIVYSAIFNCYTVTFFCKNTFYNGKAKENVDEKSVYGTFVKKH